MAKLGKNEIILLLGGIFLLGIVILAALLGYTYANERSRIERESDEVVEQTIGQISVYLNEAIQSSTRIADDPQYISQFNREITEEYLAGNIGPYLEFYLKALLNVYSGTASVLYSEDGEVLASATQAGSLAETPFSASFSGLQSGLAASPAVEFRGDTYVVGLEPVFLTPESPRQYIGIAADMSETIGAIRQGYTDKINGLTVNYLIAFLAFLLLLAVLVFWVIRKIIIRYVLRPVKQLSAASHQIMEGDLAYEIPPVEDSSYQPIHEILVAETRMLQEAMGDEGARPEARGGGDAAVSAGSRPSKGRELTKVLLSTSAVMLLFVVSILLYTFISQMIRIGEENEYGKDVVVEQLAEYAQSGLAQVTEFAAGEAIVYYSPDVLTEVANGRIEGLLNFFMGGFRGAYGAEYLAMVIPGEKVLGASVKPGLEGVDFPMSAPPEGYRLLSELGGSQGFFLSVYQPITLRLLGSGEAFLHMAVDRTAQLEELNQIYASEKSSLIWRQVWLAVLALVVASVLSYLVVWWLVKRYVIDPVTELTETADRILDGSFSGEILVKEGSAYTDLQKLLASGVIVLSRAPA